MAAFLTGVRRTASLTKSHGLGNYGVVSVLFQRSVYGNNYLAIDDFLQHRERISLQYHDMKGKFTSRMMQIVNSNAQEMVFTEDLKHLAHLAENKSEDLDLLVNMMKKFNNQNKELRFGTYVFGPVVMRLLHYLEVPDLAYQVLKDEALSGFFDQITSYTIAMDLLYKHGKYQQVIEVFDLLISHPVFHKFPRDPMVLMLASCYKLNTPEAFQIVVQRLQEARVVDAIVLRKGVTFASALALKQNKPSQALEILNMTRQINYFTVKNLKVVALVQINRLEDALMIMKLAVERDIPDAEKRSPEFCQETLSIVKEAIDLSQNKENALIFQRLEQVLRELNVISQESLEQSICSPILKRPLPRTDSRVVGFESKFFVPGSDRGERPMRHSQSYAMRHRKSLLDSEE